MYLKSIEINNFRKFGLTDNKIGFVKAGSRLGDNSPIASSTTIIVGKNNAGKTTITKALEFIVDEGEKISGALFNFNYLNSLLNDYLNNSFDKTPELSFTLEVVLDDGDNDVTTHFGPFINIKDIKNKEVVKTAKVRILYEISNKDDFRELIEFKLSQNKNNERSIMFRILLECITISQFRRVVSGLRPNGEKNIRLKDIIDLKVISATNNINDKKLLAKSFNRIIKFIYENNNSSFKSISNLVDKNNKQLTRKIRKTHQQSLASVLEKVVSENALSFSLRAELTFERLMTDLVTYEHKDGDFFIPEGQFGLGYANLINILSEIIDFAYKIQHQKKQSKVQLLCIEEPEVFMHPQMQTNFIRHIEEALQAVLEISKRDISGLKSQIVITTHSSHILNSIIHESASLDEINYTYSHTGNSKNIIISDSEISNNKKEKDIFLFIKKHIKHQVPELFFSDAIILVEGITEERIINHHIESDDYLRKKNISVFRIDGAHGSVYVKLLKLIKTPSLIITDIDFYREPETLYSIEKTIDGKEIKVEIYPQFESIESTTKTTNKTLHSLWQQGNISPSRKYHLDCNVRVVYQIDPVTIIIDEGLNKNFYATSFEEALILENHSNDMLMEVLKNVIPTTMQEILRGDTSQKNILSINSFQLQKKLSENKSKFANEIIYSIVNPDQFNSKKLTLPKYILDGIDWLAKYSITDAGAL